MEYETRKDYSLLEGLKIYDLETHLAWLRSKKKAKYVTEESLPEQGYCNLE